MKWSSTYSLTTKNGSSKAIFNSFSNDPNREKRSLEEFFSAEKELLNFFSSLAQLFHQKAGPQRRKLKGRCLINVPAVIRLLVFYAENLLSSTREEAFFPSFFLVLHLLLSNAAANSSTDTRHLDIKKNWVKWKLCSALPKTREGLRKVNNSYGSALFEFKVFSRGADDS